MAVVAQVFISHSSKDNKVARTICSALESRGFICWIASRDVGPGENFMEAIVSAIAAAKVMVLVFSESANNSDEIKRELVLASEAKLAVIPVRVEEVKPKGAFAYQLATRQWIDLFEDWENEIDRLARSIGNIVPIGIAAAAAHAGTAPRRDASEAHPHPASVEGDRREQTTGRQEAGAGASDKELGANAPPFVEAKARAAPPSDIARETPSVRRQPQESGGAASATGERSRRHIYPWLLGFAMSAAGLIATIVGIGNLEGSLGRTLVLAGSVMFTGGVVNIGLAARRGTVFRAIGLSANTIGLAAIGFGSQFREFEFGGMFILSGAFAIMGGLTLVALAERHTRMVWGLGASTSVIGLIAVGYGLPIRDFQLGYVLIVSGTVVLTGGLMLLALAAKRPMATWAIGLSASAIGLCALISGIPTRDFAFGGTLVLCGSIALAGGLVQVALAARRPMAFWTIGLSASAAGLVAIMYGISIIHYGFGRIMVLSGAVALTAGMSLSRRWLEPDGCQGPNR